MAAGFILVPAGTPLADALLKLFYTIVIPGAIATAIGSMVIYAIGYYGGHGVVRRFGRFLGTSVNDIEKTSRKMHKGKKTWISIIILRAVPIFPTSVVTLACGIMRLDVKKYFITTLIGAIPRIFILSFIGWQLGDNYIAIAENIGKYESMILGIIVVIIIAGLIYLWKRKMKKGRQKSRQRSKHRR